MIRYTAAVLVMMCLAAAPVQAQDNAFTITSASASVHRSPSVGSPVIGRAARGESLEITREVGDWVKVAWPSDPTGAGYVRLNAGTRGRPAAAATRTPAQAATAAARTGRDTPPRVSDVTRRPVTVAAETAPRTVAPNDADAAQTTTRQPVPLSSNYVARPRHSVGIGGRVNAPSHGVGGSVRAWSPGLLGVQFDVTRFSVSSPVTTDQMTTTQFAPTLLLKPADKLSDYVWLRPYGGIGVGFYRTTLTAPTVGFSTSDSRMAVHFFGGAELTFASMPSLGLSVDYGVRSFDSPFLGFDVSGSSLGLSGHWYIK